MTVPSPRTSALAQAASALASALLIAACGGGTSTTRRTPTATTVTAAPTQTATVTMNSTPASVSATATSTAGAAPARPLPLAGRTVGIDPGHNGLNATDPSYINHLIWDGREMHVCNTTGTATDAGYPESQFNWNVASDLAAILTGQGARVVMTRHNNDGVGPCVNTRAAIIDRSGAQVAIDIHADGGPASGRGVAILEPVADGPNNHVIGASIRFGADVLHQMETVAGMSPSTYDGTGGIVFRNNLAGLNLTTVPEVLIESGNMRNGSDAALLITPAFQRLEARALDRAILQFLTGRP